MNSFEFIHCFPLKQSKRSLLSLVIFTPQTYQYGDGCTFAIGKDKTFISENLERSLTRYIDNNNLTIVSDMRNKNIFTASNFSTDYSYEVSSLTS